MTMFLQPIIDSLSRLIFPPRCYVCDMEITELPAPDRLLNRFFCPDCHEALIINPWVSCNFCGAYKTEERNNSKRCQYCRKGTYTFDKVVSLGMYDGLMREAVLMIKKPEHVLLAKALAESLYRLRLKETPLMDVDWIVPVPMHKFRKAERGINDAEVIAQTIAQLSHRKYIDAFSRSTTTVLQRELNPRQRHENVRGVFDWKWFIDTQKPPRSVLIIDDILTTGSTCTELSRMMKAIGVENVYVAVIARAVGD